MFLDKIRIFYGSNCIPKQMYYTFYIDFDPRKHLDTKAVALAAKRLEYSVSKLLVDTEQDICTRNDDLASGKKESRKRDLL